MPMETQKWNYKGEEIDIPIVGKEDIDRPITDLDETMEIPLNDINNKLDKTIEISIQEGEDYE